MRLPLSAFTGKPDFYQAVHFLDDVWLRCRNFPLPTDDGASVDHALFSWHNRTEMMRQLGLLAMSDHEYEAVVKRLERLRPFVQAVPEVGDLLMRLSPNLTDVLDETLTATTKGPASLLKNGHAMYDSMHDVFIGKGFRKTATATVMVKERVSDDMMPRFVINDRPHYEYFQRLADRIKLANVLSHASDRGWDAFTKVHVLATVQGGGISGQAGAVALGLARALALHPERFQRLNHAGLLTRDARIVERKKPGQEKARKKFTWVKR